MCADDAMQGKQFGGKHAGPAKGGYSRGTREKPPAKHAASPMASQAREATAMPYIGKRRKS